MLFLSLRLFYYMQCMTWNHPQEFRCARCGSYGPSRPPDSLEEDDGRRPFERPSDRYNDRHASGLDPNHSAQRGPSSHGHPARRESSQESEKSIDEFGRVIRSLPTSFKQPRTWPLNFDTDGAAFVLDVRSGMFYDAESDFFYDPKSCLYYGKGAYYKYNANLKPPFEVMPGATNVTTDLEPVLGRPNSNDSNKKAITIKLRTKSLKKAKPPTSSSSSGSAKATASVVDSQQSDVTNKQHAADIQKWSERQKEISSNNDEAPKEVARTAKGEPICVLCQRKFPTLEKLRYHEQVSELHKENLAKQQQAALLEKQKQPPQENSSVPYVDRAQLRRTMYGSSDGGLGMGILAVGAPPSAAVSSSSARAASTATEAPVSASQDALGSLNVGHQMLQKLGWKQGDALGGRLSSVGSNNVMEKEWDRIEQAAAPQSRQEPRGGIGT